MKKKTIGLFVGALLLSTSALSLSLGLKKDSPQVVFGEVSIKSKYSYGSTVFIPEIVATLESGQINIKPRIIFPSKKCIEKCSTVLDEIGKYEVLYETVVDGESFFKSYSFVVDTNLFTLGAHSTAYYGRPENAKEHNGLVFNLVQGEEVLFNKPIDVSSFTSDDFIVSGYIAPETIGKYDFEKLLITLYDSEDPNIYYRQHIRRRDMVSTGINPTGRAYYYGGANGQGTAGANVKEADPQAINKNNEWGPMSLLPFDGEYNIIYLDEKDGYKEKEAVFDKYYVDDYLFRLSMDMQGYEVYTTEYQRDRTGAFVSGPNKVVKHFITDLNSPNFYNTLFYGFPSGKVRVGITADMYVKEYAQFVITDINGIDLKEDVFSDELGPEIKIENTYGSEMPLAKVGYSYEVPYAYAIDEICGECSVKKEIWFNYGSERATRISLDGNRFKTNKIGWYTIVYSSSDAFGNLSEEYLSVYCGNDNDVPDLDVTIGEYKQSMFMGEKLIPATFLVSNNCGPYSYEIQFVDPDGEVYDYEKGFIPEVKGEWEVKYKVTDMIGRVVEKSYTLDVSISPLPILQDSDDLPRAFIGGGGYELPQKSGYLYVDDYDYEIVDCDLVVTCDGNKETITDIYEVPNYLDNNIKINCAYVYEDNILVEEDIPYVHSLTKTENEDIPVEVDLENYFIGENMSIVQSAPDTNRGMIASVNEAKPRSTVLFANKLLADKFNLNLISHKDSAKYSSLEIKISDSLDRDNSITTVIDVGQFDSTIKVGSNSSKINFNKSNECNLSISYSQGIIYCNEQISTSFNVLHNDKGLLFEDFHSNKIYVEITLVDAYAGASLDILKVNNHIMTNSGQKIDSTVPEVIENGVSGGTYPAGEIYESSTMISQDVVAPNTEALLDIKDPNNSFIGRELDATISYTIPLDLFGTYRFEYTVYEIFYNDEYEPDSPYEKPPVRVYSADVEPPEITLLQAMPLEATIGQIITLSDYQVKDNASSEENIVVTRMVVAPNGLIYMLDKNIKRLQITMLGTYEIQYIAFDEQGNMALVSHRINVK